MAYGSGASLSSFLVNGISYNDYSSIPFDLNRIESEYIDSVEVIPLPRGFLYGPVNNSSMLNFIGKDFLSITPYTRIKYYEGPYGDGFIDGMFNSVISNRFNLFINITNRKADTRYSNTDFSMWNARVQLKYLLNNSVNLISGYDYSNTNSGAPGGIDVLNMTIDEKGFYDALYNDISSPSVFPDLRYNTFGHTLFLKMLGLFGQYASTDANVYYRFNRIELNGNVNDSTYLDNLFKNKIYGISLTQDFRYNIFNLKVLANFESADIKNYTGISLERLLSSPRVTRLNAAGIFSVSLFDSFLNPSLFYKISREKISVSSDYSGFGSDIAIKLPLNSKLYAGYSRFENSLLKKHSKNFQLGISYSNMNFNAGLNYFSRDGEINYYMTDTILNINSPHYYPGKINGLSADINILVSKILIEGKADYYRKSGGDITNIFPSAYITGGVYYRDSLFYGNLDLKTGFNISWYGRRNLSLAPQYFYIFKENTAGPDMTLNFFLSGEIQNRAIIFFSWENLLDRKFFIVPFYPMPPRGIRFGVSWELFN